MKLTLAKPINPFSCPLAARLSWPLSVAAILVSGCSREQPASVVNYETKRPISNATIFHTGKIIRTDVHGEFALGKLDQSQPLLLRAAGFWPRQVQCARAKAATVGA